MKKHLIYFCTLCCVLLLASCKYDDADLWSSLDELGDRVAALEKASQQAQTDILALQTLTQKMSESVTISSVITNEDNSYTINFSDGTKVKISNGEDGITPPSLSIEEENGIYYWVLVSTDGSKEYLEDKSGQKIQVNGQDGRSPQVRINPESEEWEISTDEGGTWTSTGVKAKGENGDAYFSDVKIEDDYVVFTLAAGGEIRLLRSLELEISFTAEGKQEFSFGEQRVLPMVISGAVRFSISKPDGWRAQLTDEGLSVTAPVKENEWAETTGTISVVGFTSSGQGAVAEIEVSASLAAGDGQDFTEMVKGVELKMVYVKGGTFSMGATEDEQTSDPLNDNDFTIHDVTLSDYYIGKIVVTQGLWKAVMGSNPSYFDKGDDYPVEQVSWDDIQDFLNELNRLTDKEYALPTEAQWEYAARGGVKSMGYKYSGSNEPDDVWHYGNSDGSTHPVGQKQPNELGLYDMSGNVWEWCNDWEAPYSSEPQTNPTGPDTGIYRIMRGGSFKSNAEFCYVSYRYGDTPDKRNYNSAGFRVVCIP